MENTATAALPISRSSRDWITPVALRALLKANLGLNARKVSVSMSSSGVQYLTITVRDTAVDVAAVKAFAATLHTWTMDQTDYCEGQSIHVLTTKEVDAAHAAPFVAEVTAVLDNLAAQQDGNGIGLINGKILWRDDRSGYHVTAESGYRRGCYIWPQDVASRQPYAIQALALQAARV